MPNIRALRRSRGLTLAELALQIGIPTRTLAEIEYGLQSLDTYTQRRLADVFGLAPAMLYAAGSHSVHPAPQPGPTVQQIIPLALAGLTGALVLVPMLQQGQPASLLRSAPAQARASVIQPTATLAPTASRPITTQALASLALPTATPPQPSPTPQPLFELQPDGPHGCPLQEVQGRIVITQGYGVGTHAPADVWGAIDLALDGNDDGYAEPDTTFGAPVVATHHGVARVFPNSWPGGNFIILDHAESGYSTAYGHLDTIMITDGQFIEAGTQIGTIGTTGMSSGPHLHYEIRTPHGNIDPAPLVGCG